MEGIMQIVKWLKRRLAAFLVSAGLQPTLVTAQGNKKQTVIKKQAGLGTPAVGAGGQILRRESSTFTLTKGIFESGEIVSHQQHMGVRHGMHGTTGKLAGVLSPGTYKLFMASALRKDFVAGATTGAIVTVAAAVTTGAQGTFIRSAGSFLADGFKVFDVVRWVGWATTGVPNNTHNFLIIALTATTMTVLAVDSVPVGAKVAGDSVTCTVVGKKTLAPLTGHTDDLYTVEEWYPDIVQSELFTDVRLNQFTVDVPGSGLAKVSFDLPGLKRALNNAQQLTTPAVETVTGICEVSTGALMINGVQMLAVTGVKLQVDEAVTPDGPVVGSLYAPDAARGKIKVTGSFTAYFQDQSLTSLYQNETVLGLGVVVCADNTPASDFLAFGISALKLTGDAPDDGEKGVLRTIPFTGQINLAGGAGLANDQTILSIQDSQA
jgi:hypothetical protein